MKENLKEIIGFILRFSGIVFLIREIFLRNKVIIAVYHDPEPAVFAAHIEYLSKKYNIISLNMLVNAIHNKDWSDIPAKSLVITLDDGHKDNYKLLKILKAYRVPVTIYLCSHIVNTNRKFWFKTGLPDYSKLKRYSNKQRIEALKSATGYEPKKEFSSRQTLNSQELKEMSAYVDFQAHTKLHPILTACSDQESKEEIQESKDYLEKLLNKKIEHFNYPNGDYADREINNIKNSGFRSARTLDIGWNHINSDPYRLKAIGIQDEASVNILCVQIIGLYGYLHYLSHGNYLGKRPQFL